MSLQFAILKTVPEPGYTVQLLDSQEELEARLSGPAAQLGILPRVGQLVAVDLSLHPLEIVHAYGSVDPARLTAAGLAALARDTFPLIQARHTPLEQAPDPDPAARSMSWTGIAAEVWDPSGGDTPQSDHDYLKTVVEANHGPALDIGCGSGRLLLRYLAAGLEVEGVDTSADMLARCRGKGAAQGLAPVLYQQSMHELDLPRRYRTIFIPCGTFCLLIRREDAQQALQRLYQHLEPGGELVFNLFWEIGKGGWFWHEADGKWHYMFHHALPNGGEVYQYMLTEKVDRAEQQFFGKRRYWLVRQGQVVREEIFPANERVYGKYEIQMMLEQAGFQTITIKGDWSEAPFSDQHQVMVIHARK